MITAPGRTSATEDGESGGRGDGSGGVYATGGPSLPGSPLLMSPDAAKFRGFSPTAAAAGSGASPHHSSAVDESLSSIMSTPRSAPLASRYRTDFEEVR